MTIYIIGCSHMTGEWWCDTEVDENSLFETRCDFEYSFGNYLSKKINTEVITYSFPGHGIDLQLYALRKVLLEKKEDDIILFQETSERRSLSTHRYEEVEGLQLIYENGNYKMFSTSDRKSKWVSFRPYIIEKFNIWIESNTALTFDMEFAESVYDNFNNSPWVVEFHKSQIFFVKQIKKHIKNLYLFGWRHYDDEHDFINMESYFLKKYMEDYQIDEHSAFKLMQLEFNIHGFHASYDHTKDYVNNVILKKLK